MKIVAEFEQSLKTHPPIAPGTPDPYQPPNARGMRIYAVDGRARELRWLSRSRPCCPSW